MRMLIFSVENILLYNYTVIRCIQDCNSNRVLRIGGSLRTLVQVLRRRTARHARYRSRFLGVEKIKGWFLFWVRCEKYSFDLRKSWSFSAHCHILYTKQEAHTAFTYIIYGTRNLARLLILGQHSTWFSLCRPYIAISYHATLSWERDTGNSS